MQVLCSAHKITLRNLCTSGSWYRSNKDSPSFCASFETSGSLKGRSSRTSTDELVIWNSMFGEDWLLGVATQRMILQSKVTWRLAWFVWEWPNKTEMHCMNGSCADAARRYTFRAYELIISWHIEVQRFWSEFKQNRYLDMCGQVLRHMTTPQLAM